VRALYGAPSKTDKQTFETYDTETWVYEGPQAPAGLTRLTVEYGLVLSEKYQPNVVRVLAEPLPGGFTRTIINRMGPARPGRPRARPTSSSISRG
jgi:hypothetical protein